MPEQKHATYKDAGVDIDAGNEFVQRIKPFVKATERPEVIGDIGGFGGLFSGEKIKKMDHPVFVSGTDGVGTKLKLAFMSGKHETVGIDLVAMCVNDIVVQGAEPLFFLDYLATSKLEPEEAALVVKGIAAGCIQAGCALIGGETAELPGFYHDGEYDVAGFAVGVVEYDKIIDGSGISAGDKLIGIASSGLHSNGFSLARKIIFEIMGFDINDELPGFGKTVADELLTPTKIYVKSILSLIEAFEIKGIAHITGGGLLENVPRILPENCKAIIHTSSWKRHLIFDFLKNGNIEESEMLRTFNCGIGMVIAVKDEEVEDALLHLACLGEDAFLIGGIAERKNGEEPITFI